MTIIFSYISIYLNVHLSNCLFDYSAMFFLLLFFSYVSVLQGNTCFCGRNAPPGSAVDAAANCNTQCTGDSAVNCGGATHAHIYKTPTTISGLQLTAGKDMGEGMGVWVKGCGCG